MAWRHVSPLRLEMTNFKRFYGRHHLDLESRPRDGRPLVLIGGDNGRGKTSIHEAINYALYEDGDLPGIQTRPSYLRAVSDRLNRRALDEGSTEYRVAVELSANDGGPDRRIRIERSWTADVSCRTALESDLSIYENGRPLDYVHESEGYYQDFVRSMLPPRIAPFFFFDGERIQEFAEDENHERRMVDAIEDILHITVYKALRDDLRKYVGEHIDRTEVKPAAAYEDIFDLEKDKDRLVRVIGEKKDRLADVDREIVETDRKQKRLAEDLRKLASPYDPERAELIAEERRLKSELDEASSSLHQAFQAVPLLLAGQLRRRLRLSLEEGRRGVTTAEQLQALREQIEDTKRRVLVDPRPRPPAALALTEGQQAFYCERYDEVTREVFHLDAPELGASPHDLASAERQRILDRLAQVEGAGARLREAVGRSERLSAELRAVETKLQSTSEDPYIAQLIEEKRAADERRGALQQQRDSLAGELQRLEADLAQRERQIEARLVQRQEAGRARSAVTLARKARAALDEFVKRLASEKLSLLQRHMDEMYSRLRKPEDPVHSLEIDPETWQVVLKDEQGRPLEKRVFSAGMKEMYALALLWALARASGRELPIVIDTPVGRLDTTNRRALFERYLPHAGHQVVVLCTDTEVDREWAQRLEPYVARQYRLDYDSEMDSIAIRPGFFF